MIEIGNRESICCRSSKTIPFVAVIISNILKLAFLRRPGNLNPAIAKVFHERIERGRMRHDTPLTSKAITPRIVIQVNAQGNIRLAKERHLESGCKRIHTQGLRMPYNKGTIIDIEGFTL